MNAASRTTHPAHTSTIEHAVKRHLTAGSGLLTVCATPAGVASYLVPDADSAIERITHDGGSIAVEWITERFGTVWSVITGGAVTEIALHDTQQQEADYREVCAQVDQENRENALEAVRLAAGALLAEAGIEIEQSSNAEMGS